MKNSWAGVKQYKNRDYRFTDHDDDRCVVFVNRAVIKTTRRELRRLLHCFKLRVISIF